MRAIKPANKRRAEATGRPVSRILSGRGTCLGGHLSGQRCYHHCSVRPTRSSRGAGHTPAADGCLCPCLALLPTGVAWPRRLPDAPVGSYPTFSPLPAPALAQAAGGLFLWPCPRGCPLPGVTRRRALWSADFPRRHHVPPRPPGRPTASCVYLKRFARCCQQACALWVHVKSVEMVTLQPRQREAAKPQKTPKRHRKRRDLLCALCFLCALA